MEDEISSIISNILIVDDSPVNLNVLEYILKGSGYKVRPVTNGLMALQVAEKEKPDVVLLDIIMPDIDGYEVCRRFKENQNLCDIPIIFISAMNEINYIVKALASGGADYITKPFQAEEVKARVATHLKLYQQKQKLQKQSKELKDLMVTKEKLFSIISHDLRSPFSVILWYSETLAENEENLEKIKIKEYATGINTIASATLKLLDNLLQWSRIQKGILIPKIQNINFKDIANEIMKVSQEIAKSKGITLKNNIVSDIFAYCDEEMTLTILRNLITNAIKFTNKKGVVSFEAKPQDSFLEIKVSDNGVGIPSEKISHLFYIDKDISTLDTENEKGSGLGLMLCKELVEMQGGKMGGE